MEQVWLHVLNRIGTAEDVRCSATDWPAQTNTFPGRSASLMAPATVSALQAGRSTLPQLEQVMLCTVHQIPPSSSWGTALAVHPARRTPTAASSPHVSHSALLTLGVYKLLL